MQQSTWRDLFHNHAAVFSWNATIDSATAKVLINTIVQ